MPQRSPIMRFALEVFEHGLERYVANKPRDRKLAVMSLAQVLELSVKATLVERNIAIHEKDGTRTINAHSGLVALAKLWSLERIPAQSRVELLINERNAIQHQYGAVDDVTMDYHLQTTFTVLSEIFQREFDTDLYEWVRTNVDAAVWSLVRFVPPTSKPEAPLPSGAVVNDRSTTLDFIDGFARYESALRKAVAEATTEQTEIRSTLDVVMKFLANLPEVDGALLERVPPVYRLRNQVFHGTYAPAEAELRATMETLDQVVTAVRAAENAELVRRAVEASLSKRRGTSLGGVGALTTPRGGIPGADTNANTGTPDEAG